MKTRITALVFAVVLLLTASATTAFANTSAKQNDLSNSNNAKSDEVVWMDGKDSDIPDEYREFVREGSKYYHATTMASNVVAAVGETVKRTRTLEDGTKIDVYYVSMGKNDFHLATPEGRILTAEELDEYFLGILPPKTTYEPMEWENEMIRLVNIEREKAGVAPVEANTKLMEIASLKAKEMSELGYASHTSPRYGSPSAFAKHYGYEKTVGENIQGGFAKDISPQGVLTNWLNSEVHKKNLLNPNWKYIGTSWSNKQIAFDDGSSSTTYRFVQLFSK